MDLPSTTVTLEGLHALKHAHRFGAVITDILTDDLPGVLALAASLAPDVVPLIEQRAEVIPTARFRELTRQPVPTHLLSYAERPRWELAQALPTAGRPTVLLDDPRNSKNLGAVVRVAAAAGAAGVLVNGPADLCDPMAVRGAAGLQWAVPGWGSPPLLDPLDAARTGWALVGLDADGDPFQPTTEPVMYAFGSERTGLSAKVRARCDRLVALPMRPGVSSLNLATCVSAVLYLSVYAGVTPVPPD